ncbi:MAG: site-specific DNA-methyltransferase [Gordonia sp. (in: high G+C Gram-positive bacteria)]|nr:MAG: site-specific DNA-methyltransferase [Gordonia sp. (in: high G+C Gram-positive bacteria)]
MTSPDLTRANIDKIADLFPNVVTERSDADSNPVRAVDFDLLRQELSDHIVEGPQERYRLDWPGKRAAAFTANAPIAKTLRPVREESVDFDTTKNLFIEGDNLDALKLLQESYLGKVKLIYIDPPYNTGNDFVYEDDFAESNEEYLERSGQTDSSGARLTANTESNGRFHSDWLSMMYPRLKLARNLLSDDGVMFVSIDDGEHAGLVEVLKELFGANNYIASVARVTKKTSNKGTHFAPSKDYVVAVARNASAVPPLMDEVPDEYRKKFSGRDDRGHFATVGLYQASLDPLRGCANQRYWIEAPDGTFVLPPGPNRPASVGDASNRPPESREDRVWRWSFQSYLEKKDLLVFKETPSSPLQDQYGRQSRWNVYTKYYLEDRLGDGIRPRDFLDGVTNDQGTKALIKLGLGGIFDFAKPPQLVSKLLTWIDDPHAVILDFFAGSGTTAQAVIDHNELDGGGRRFICIQLDEECPEGSEARRAGFTSIAEIARERVRRSGQALVEREGLSAGHTDRGFRALRVDTTNLEDTLRAPNATNQFDLESFQGSIKPSRSGEDLLFHVLLDWGLDLSLPIVRETVDDRGVYSVDDDALVACFAEYVTPEVVRVIAERGPLRAVFRDDAFESDAARINAEQVFREVSPATEVRTI